MGALGLITMLILVEGRTVAAPRQEGSRARARVLFLKAKAAYRGGRFAAAIVAFRAAGRLRPSPLLTFNIARCHEKLGHARAAIGAYRRYLRARPRAKNRSKVQAQIALLLRRLARGRREAKDPYEDLEAGSDHEAAGSDHEAAGVAPGARNDHALPVSGTDHGGAEIIPPAMGAPAPVGIGGAASTRPMSLPEASDMGGTGRRAVAVHVGDSGSGGSLGGVGRGDASGLARGDVPTPVPKDARFRSFSPRSGASAKRRSGPATPPLRRRVAAPIYKQWWFWVAIGAGVVIGGFVIAMSTGSSSRAAQQGGSASSLRFRPGVVVNF